MHETLPEEFDQMYTNRFQLRCNNGGISGSIEHVVVVRVVRLGQYIGVYAESYCFQCGMEVDAYEFTSTWSRELGETWVHDAITTDEQHVIRLKINTDDLMMWIRWNN